MEQKIKKNSFYRKMQLKYYDLPLSLQKGKFIFCYLMIAAAVIGFAVFYIGGNLSGILLTFQRNVLSGGIVSKEWSFVNIERVFKDFFNESAVLSSAFINTIKTFFWTTLVLFPINFMISYFLYKRIYLYSFYRLVFYLPGLISGVLLVTTFKEFISATGPLSFFLGDMFGYTLPSLLTQESTAMSTIIFYSFWLGLGSNMLLVTGAMTRVSRSLVECAELDGCNAFQEMRYILLPLTWGTISTLFLLSIVGIFSASGPILLFTNGQYKTFTLSFYIYYNTLAGTYNYPSAIGFVFTILALPIVMITRWLMNRVNKDTEI